jgi:hypothetical protein
MRIACPRCREADVTRIRRCGIFDQIGSFFGRWPYCCRSCRKRFYAGQRRPPERYSPQAQQRRRAAYNSSFNGVQMAYRTDPVRPTAKIVLQTDTYWQMNEILLALNRAVEYYKQPIEQHANSER